MGSQSKLPNEIKNLLPLKRNFEINLALKVSRAENVCPLRVPPQPHMSFVTIFLVRNLWVSRLGMITVRDEFTWGYAVAQCLYILEVEKVWLSFSMLAIHYTGEATSTSSLTGVL